MDPQSHETSGIKPGIRLIVDVPHGTLANGLADVKGTCRGDVDRLLRVTPRAARSFRRA